MPSFIQLIQLILLFCISASTVSANGTGGIDDADNEHKQAQAEINLVIRVLRKMTDLSMPEFCSECSQGISYIHPPSNVVQLNYAQDLTNLKKYFRANAQRIADEKYGGNPIPKEKQTAECTSLLRVNLIQHLRTQSMAFEFNDPSFDVFGLAFGNRDLAASPEAIIVALQQFTSEVQHDGERYGCSRFQETNEATARSNAIDSPSSSSSDPVR